MPRLEDLLAELPELVPLHEAVMRAINLMQDPRSNAAKVARVIETDQALTAKVLQFANSAWYFLPRRTTSVEEALVRIGNTAAREILYSAAAWRTLNRDGGPKEISPRRLWQHSVATAYSARILATRTGIWKPNEAYIAGLLHDLGIQAMAKFAPVEMSQVVAETRMGTPMIQVERKIMGFDHAEVCACLLESWGLPHATVEAVRWHHLPLSTPATDRFASVIHVADGITHVMGVPPWPVLRPQAADWNVIESLGLDLDAMTSIVEEAESALRRAEDDLGLALERAK
jgi:HD-like signal output (HDOD) protein